MDLGKKARPVLDLESFSAYALLVFLQITVSFKYEVAIISYICRW